MRSRVNNSKITNNEDILQEINKKNQQAQNIQFEISQIQNEIGDMVETIDTIEKEITSNNSEGRSDLAMLQTKLEKLHDEQKKLRGSSDKKLKELKIKSAKVSKEMRELIDQGVFIDGIRYKMVWNSNTMVALEQLYTSYNEWENLMRQNSPSAILNGAHVMIAEFVRLHNADIEQKITFKAPLQVIDQSHDTEYEIHKLEATKLKVPSLEDIGLVPPAIITLCVLIISGYMPSVYSN